jgi:hypothetical protein
MVAHSTSSGFVVLHDAQSVEDIDRIQLGFDRFEEKGKTEALKKLAGLGEIRAFAEVQGECFEPAGADPKPAHYVSRQKDRPAINAAGKGHPDRFVAWNAAAIGDFISQSADVAAPISSKSSGKTLRVGVKKRV